MRLILPLLTSESFTLLTVEHFLMFLHSRSPAPALTIANNDAVCENIKNRIILDRAHVIGRLHDLVGGV